MHIPPCPGLNDHNFEAFVVYGHEPQKVREWADALASGEYSQTQKQLHRTHAQGEPGEEDFVPAGWCCIGVGCDLINLPSAPGSTGAIEYFEVDPGHVSDVWVDPPKFLGGPRFPRRSLNSFHIPAYYPDFATANDSEGMRFADLAVWLRAAADEMERRNGQQG